MKKVQLKALDLGVKQLLNREQMKRIVGGSGSGSGTTKSGKCCGSPNGEVYGNGTIACSTCVTTTTGTLVCATGTYLVAC